MPQIGSTEAIEAIEEVLEAFMMMLSVGCVTWDSAVLAFGSYIE